MKPTVAALWIVAGFAGCLLAEAAVAEDLGSSGGGKNAQAPSKVDQDISQAIGASNAASSSDLDARVKDLDETRTAIDQKKPPTVSLSVSGWVTQQVQYNVK